MLINPYCRDYGWLFEDLKASLCEVELAVPWHGDRDRPGGFEDVEVVGSEEPLPDADAWICLRSGEHEKSPDLARTVVQVHDYRPKSIRCTVGAVQCVNQGCAESVEEIGPARIIPGVSDGARLDGADVAMPRYQILPIGPRSAFKVRESMPERPTVGWVGRDVVHEGRHIKRPELFVEVVRELRAAGVEVAALMYGPLDGPGQIGPYFDSLPPSDHCEATDGALLLPDDWPDLTSEEIDAVVETVAPRSVASLQRFYHSIDVLVSTTDPEPGPLSIYEALACGVPVVSTPTGAAEEMGAEVCIEEHEFTLRSSIHAALTYRKSHFRRRHEIAATVAHLSQEAWARRSVELAVEVARG